MREDHRIDGHDRDIPAFTYADTGRYRRRETEEDLNPLFPGPVFQVQYPEYPADTTPLNICSHCRWLSFQANKLPTERHNKKMYMDCRSVSDNQS